MNRAEQAEAFCSALFGGLDGDDRLAGLYSTVWSSADKLTRWRPADQPGAVASVAAGLDEQRNAKDIYIGVGLADAVTGKVPEGTHFGADGGPVTVGRPTNDTVAGLLGLWADIDIAGDGHADTHYPPTVEAAKRVVDAMRIPPTMIVHSGGGLQVWWMFTEPWLVRDALDPAAEREVMRKLAFDWLRAVQYQAELLGRFKIDSVFDLARLLRPAGTTNRKIAGNPRKVEVLHHDPNATYNPSDFDEYLPDPAVLAAYAKPVNNLGSAGLTEAQAAMVAEVNFAAVWARVNSPAYRALDFTPGWLSDILELGEEIGNDAIAKTWAHDRPEFKDDETRFDASLIKLLSAFEFLDTEALIEALMCRRLRLTDTDRADKINPRRRLDYIVRTVATFRARAVHETAVKEQGEHRVAEMASATLAPLPAPAPVTLDVEADHRGRVAEPEAEAAFTAFTDELIDQPSPPTDAQVRRAADDVVVEQHTGHPPVPVIEEDGEEEPADDPFELYGQRPAVEVACLDTLTDLLLPGVYRDRGVRVWAIEYRDYGELQRGRVLLRLPLDFDWPVDRPSRYRPGRPLATEWWNRNAFDSPKGYQQAVERDCKIVTREDAPKADWATLIRSLVPLWRRDSSGSDLGQFAHEWLFGYLLLHHGTGQVNEVGASGRPWVRKTNGWKPKVPPVIFVDLDEFMNHCKIQPGAVAGRDARKVVELLKLTKRRPRVGAPGMSRRTTWYEIDPEQFNAGEWSAIIEVTRPSYERSMTGRGLHVAGRDVHGYGIGEREAL